MIRPIFSGDSLLLISYCANTGAQRMLSLPCGQYDGNTVTAWLFALHKANVFGLPYRILVCVLGLTIVMLSVTGIVIWLKKRRARQFHLCSRVDQCTRYTP